jgi:hypothetical protein
MTVNTNEKTVTKCNQRIGAIKKYVTNPATLITIDGKSYKPDEVIAAYQGLLDAGSLVITKRGELKIAVADRNATAASVRAVDKGLKAWVASTLGSTSQAAHDFGFAPKVSTKSVETKMHAVEQLRATREARGTKGPKEKAKIKGVVATPEAPAPAASPAPAAPAAGATPAGQPKP